MVPQVRILYLPPNKGKYMSSYIITKQELLNALAFLEDNDLEKVVFKFGTDRGDGKYLYVMSTDLLKHKDITDYDNW